MTNPGLQRRKHLTASFLLTVSAAMVGLAFASVPLYRLLCKAIGLGGTTQVATMAPEAQSAEEFTVRFDANTDKQLPWDFKPEVKSVGLKAGEAITVVYHAKNTSDHATRGTATFNVTPEKIGIYFNKLECFCFQEQDLAPGQETDMAVKFFIDPAILKDKTTEEVRTITLSYTFFRSLNGRPVADKTASADLPATQKTN